MSTVDRLAAHLAALHEPMRALENELLRVEEWGTELARVLTSGGRLLAVGNGGSAAQAQHLTGELVGRYAAEREPLSAIALHADTSSLTAISNDYGPAEAFARQVRAHGRAGDVLLALSTSGRSPNVLAAAETARDCRLAVWALTGPAPNPLAGLADDSISVTARRTATVQEVHLILVHLLCTAVDASVAPAAVAMEAAR